MPVAELATFKASPAYLANSAVILPACKKIVEYGGVLGIYTASSMDDGTVGYLVTVWKTLDDSKKMKQNAGYSAVTAALAAVHIGPITVLHYDITGDLAKALAATLTSFSFATLKSGKTKDAIKPFVDAVGIYIDLSQGYCSGWCLEEPTTLLTILGWASLEAHEKTTKASDFQGMVGEAMSVVNVDVKHCKVTKRA